MKNSFLELIKDFGLDPSQPQKPLFSGLIVDEITEAGTSAIAFATFYNRYSSAVGKTLYLTNIFVRSGNRGKDVGRKLFNELMKIAKRTQCSRLEFMSNVSNHGAIEFFRKLGANNLSLTEGLQVFEWETEQNYSMCNDFE